MKPKSKLPLVGGNDKRRNSKSVHGEREPDSISSLLRPTTNPAWIKGTTPLRSKGRTSYQLALKMAELLRHSKACKSNEPGPTREEFDRLFKYAFGEGRADAQLIAAFVLRYRDTPTVRKHLDKLVGGAAADGDVEFLQELAKALDEQNRSPEGRDSLRAQLMARKIKGQPGLTVSALGKILEPTARNSDERATADQTARRALRDAGMLVPDKRGFKKGAKRKPREKR